MTKAEKLAIQQQIALRLALARDIAGLTQQELSARSGVGRTYIAMLETGRSDLPCATLIQLARALGVKPAKLLP